MWKRTLFLVVVLRKYPIRKEDNSMYELYYLSVISNFIFCCKHKHWVCKHSTKIKGRLRWNANMSVLHIKDDRLDLVASHMRYVTEVFLLNREYIHWMLPLKVSFFTDSRHWQLKLIMYLTLSRLKIVCYVDCVQGTYPLDQWHH